MEISEYVRNAYRLAVPPPQRSADPYAVFKDCINRELPAFLAQRFGVTAPVAFDFHVIYAFNKYSSVVYSTVPATILHNQYLGQTFNNLNRIFRFADNSLAGFGYLFRLVEEEFRSQGKDSFGTIVAALRTHMDTNREYKTLFNRARPWPIWFPQELFVIAHEAFHWVCHDSRVYRPVMLSEARNAMERLKEVASRPEVPTLLAAVLDSQPSEDVQEKYVQAIMAYSSSDTLAEEIVCDRLAIDFVWQVLGGLDGSLLVPIYLLFRHNRLLNYIKWSVAAPNTLSWPGEFTAQCSRDTIRRSLATNYLASLLQPAPDEYSFLRQGTNTMDEKYHSTLEDIALNALQRRGDEVVLAGLVAFNVREDTYRELQESAPRDASPAADQ